MGQKIRKMRQKKGVSIEKLAELSGLSSSEVLALEEGKTKTVTNILLIKIANALDCNVSDIFF